VAIGRYKEGRIDADKLLVKCPSKYQGTEMKTYGAEAPGAPRKAS
jgi:cytochrome c-type biogenesis protein CcmE